MERPWQEFSNEQAPLQPLSLASPPARDNETLKWQSGDRILPPLRSSDLQQSIGEDPTNWNSKRPFSPNHFELPPLDTGHGIFSPRQRSQLQQFEFLGSSKRRRVEGGRFDQKSPPPQTVAADSPSLLRPRAPLGPNGM
jgi:hypothetical protein